MIRQLVIKMFMILSYKRCLMIVLRSFVNQGPDLQNILRQFYDYLR